MALYKEIGQVLQGVAEVREWVRASVPSTRSALAYELFLRLGAAFANGDEVEVQTLARELPQARDALRTELRRLQDAGLLQRHGQGKSTRVAPTDKFLALLRQYQRRVESQFIVRSQLREQQLFVSSGHAGLAAQAASWYDHCFDLGWLYLHKFGSVCYLMAALLARVAVWHGHRARVVCGWLELSGPNGRYSLGAPGLARPGQIDGHAACVVDDRLLLDFGLGNLRKGYRRSFYWGVIADVVPSAGVLARVQLPQGETLLWRTDWRSPHSAAELASYEPVLDHLMAEYRAQFGG